MNISSVLNNRQPGNTRAAMCEGSLEELQRLNAERY